MIYTNMIVALIAATNAILIKPVDESMHLAQTSTLDELT